MSRHQSMARTEKGAQSWSPNDLACTRCRDKKVRCGRERPKCANCGRDDEECSYTHPGKRVNHIKLLCDNVRGIEDRLINVEGELSQLTTLLETGGKVFGGSSAEDLPLNLLYADNQLIDDSLPLLAAGRHILRSPGDSIDRYHGPCSLAALCSHFRSFAITSLVRQTPPLGKDGQQVDRAQDASSTCDARKELLDRLCLEAGTEESFELPAGQCLARLPPKQFLLMAQQQFFQQVDCSFDIFVQSSFLTNLERIYSGPVMPADEVWVICFKTIVLLVLGTELHNQGNDPLFGGFAQSYPLTSRAALENPRLSMVPRLINVQTLILLSIAAQQFDPPGWAELTLAQACVLARTMGLHQTHAAPEGFSAEEAPERFKVFRALYVRDKSFSISRGSVCWLPSYDCSLVSQLGKGVDDQSDYADRIRLAMSEDEIYRLAHSAESQRQSSDKFKGALHRVEQGLERWASTYGAFDAAEAGSHRAIIQLEFLAARLSAFCDSTDVRYAQRALTDARASCLLLLIACGRHDSSIFGQFESLPLSSSSRASRDANPQSRTSKANSQEAVPKSTPTPPSEPNSLRYHTLLETFSVPALFLLVKSVLWPADIDEAQTDSDLHLLQKVWACYEDYDSRFRADNYIRKVARAFRTLLELVRLIKNPQQQFHPSPQLSQRNSISSTPPHSQTNMFGGSSGLAEFDLSNFPTWPTPPNSAALPVDNWPTKRISSRGLPSTAGIPASKDSETVGQTFDSRQFGGQFSQHAMLSSSSVSRKRPRAYGGLEAWMEDFSGSNSNPLSEFMTHSPDILRDLNS